MRKLSLLMVILLASLTVSSQTVIKNITTDSIVPLPKNVAKEVVKDILRKDSLEGEIELVKVNLDLTKQNSSAKDNIIASKDSIITLYKLKEINYNMIINFKDMESTNLQNTVKVLNDDLKKEKRKVRWGNVKLIAVAAALVYFIVK